MESFQWLFKSFLIAMGSHMPKTLTTDQDLVIRQVVVDVFETSIHLFCMWHIVRRLPEKVGRMLNGCGDFIERIKRCVWASGSCDESEDSWGRC